MKILITGGIKSGKSINAERRILEISGDAIPIYLATTTIIDDEMRERINVHRERRGKKFHTIEESLFLSESIKDKKEPVLIECLTMWLNNALHYNFSESKIFSEIENLLKLENDLVFVLNEVGMGIIPDNFLSRKFSDFSGRISQILGQSCDEVYFCLSGIMVKLK